MYNRRSVQSGGTLTIQEGRHMVQQLDDDERAKAERLLKRLEEKDLKMRRKWVDATAKIARMYIHTWRREGKLRPLYSYS